MRFLLILGIFASTLAQAQFTNTPFWHGKIDGTCGEMNRNSPAWANLIGYWKLNGFSNSIPNGAFIPSEAGSNISTSNGNGTGMANYVSQINQGIYFDGVDDFIVLPGANITSNVNLTVAAWFQTTGTGSIIGEQDVPVNGAVVWHLSPIAVGSDGLLRGEFWQGAVAPITSSSPVNDGAWHHVALSASTNTQSLYLDGALVGTLAGALNHGPMTYAQIGTGNDGGWPGGTNWHYFNGVIDEVAIWNTGLSQAQIQTIYNSQTTMCPSSNSQILINFSSAPQTVSQGLCSGVTTVHAQSPSGLGVLVNGLTVNLSGSAGVTFYSDSLCSQQVSSTTVLGTSGTFYFVSENSGSPTITASISGNSANQTETVNSYGYIWTGGGGNTSWSTGANWSGGTAPGTTNIAVFNSVCSSNCSPSLTAAISVSGIRMGSGFSGTITQGSYNVTVGTGNFVELAGTFAGSNSGAAFTDGGKFSLAGGSFTATSGTMSVQYDFSVLGSPSFTANGGTVNLYLSCCYTPTIATGSITLNNLEFTGGTTYNIPGTIIVAGNLKFNESYSNPFYGGHILVSGDLTEIWSGSGAGGGNTEIKLVGTGTQTITGVPQMSFPGLTIASSGTVNFVGTILVQGDYTVTSGTINPGTSTLVINGWLTAQNVTPGSQTYNNVSFVSNSNVNLTGTMTVGKTLQVGDTNGANVGLYGGTIQAYGDIAGIGTGFGGSTLIKAMGNPSGQTISSTSSAATIPNLIIATSPYNVTFGTTVSVSGGYTMTSVGTLNTAGSNFYLVTCNTAMTVGTELYNNVTMTNTPWCTSYLSGTLNANSLTLYSVGAYFTNFDFGGNTAIVGNLTFTGNNTLGVFNNGTILTSGNVSANTNFGSSTYGGTGVVELTGNAAGQTISNTSPGALPNLTIATGADSVTLSTAVSVGGATHVTSGNPNMSGNAFTTNSLSLSGNTLTKAGGILTVGGTVYGTGSLFGGTVAP